MKYLPIVIVSLLLAACADETISGQTDSTDIWILHTLNGAPVASSITLTFPEKGSLAGQAPCNRYSANQKAPLPWFEVGPIRATRMACDGSALEQTYFDTLSDMTLIERKQDTLLLTNDKGQSMLFTQN